MKREVKITADGSPTLYVPDLDEHYHSIHGAVTESMHIFIDAAFNYHRAKEIKIIEFGMGTGLNTLLTFNHAMKSKRKVFYHAIDKYPLTNSEFLLLGYSNNRTIDPYKISGVIQDSPWNQSVELTKNFIIYKDKNDFREVRIKGLYDIIYYDAFAPEVQPELWNIEIFSKIFQAASGGAVLTTYSSKGSVKRNLINAGFQVQKLPGPPHKREFLRATKL